MIRLLARCAGVAPDALCRAWGAMVDEFGLSAPGVCLFLVASGIAGCALGFMAP
jgi:hypothetical protein